MVKNHISYTQLKFHPHSFGDPDGRLFSLDGGLYRAISHEKTRLFARLFEDGTIEELMTSFDLQLELVTSGALLRPPQGK